MYLDHTLVKYLSTKDNGVVSQLFLFHIIKEYSL